METVRDPGYLSDSPRVGPNGRGLGHTVRGVRAYTQSSTCPLGVPRTGRFQGLGSGSSTVTLVGLSTLTWVRTCVYVPDSRPPQEVLLHLGRPLFRNVPRQCRPHGVHVTWTGPGVERSVPTTPPTGSKYPRFHSRNFCLSVRTCSTQDDSGSLSVTSSRTA